MLTADLSGITLEDILPHRGNMLLVDDVLQVNEESALISSLINRNYPLADEEGVDPLIMVELAAQAAGVCSGLIRIQAQGIESNKMGWLVGVKRAQFFIDSVPFGSTVLTRSENRHQYENLHEVFCALHMDEKLIGEVTLQLFQLEEGNI